VLEIVERILAALIILALLTLLIILAFPVPPRQTAGPTPAKPGEEVARAPAQPDQPAKQSPADPVLPPTPEPKTPVSPPATDVGGDSRAQQEADRRAQENRRRAEEEAARRADADSARRAEEEALRRKRTVPAAGCTDEECRRILRTRVRDCPEAGCPPPRRPVRRPVLKDCRDGARDCCPEEPRRRIVKRHNLPYWKDPRRYAVVEDDPDWYDERIAALGPPPGVCPD
jgi:hypothetical protein